MPHIANPPSASTITSNLSLFQYPGKSLHVLPYSTETEDGVRCMMRERGSPRRIHMAPAPPPPYEAAVYRRLWSIVAPYVNDFDLYSTCLVCRQWNHIFSPFLWGNPGSRFGNDSDNIYRKSPLLISTPFKNTLLSRNSSHNQELNSWSLEGDCPIVVAPQR